MSDSSEVLEHAHSATHTHAPSDPFISRVSITIAILAVLAASVGSLETLETAGTISAQTEAVFLQNKETNEWSYYQAKSLKKNMYEIGAESTPAKRNDYLVQASRYGEEIKEIEKNARELESEKTHKLKAAAEHEHRHHMLTGAVTFLHISIAVATLSIITGGNKWPWTTSIILGLVGLCITAYAYAGMLFGM